MLRRIRDVAAWNTDNLDMRSIELRSRSDVGYAYARVEDLSHSNKGNMIDLARKWHIQALGQFGLAKVSIVFVFV